MRDRTPSSEDREGAATGKVADRYPVNAWLALTNQCNLRCAHCAIRYQENRPAERIELGDGAFDAFASEILPHLRTLKLGGNNLGEQLAAEKWDERCERVVASGVRITLQTNGVLLSERVIQELVAAGAEFDVSVEGADPESYARIRGRHFDSVMGAVKTIVDARSKHPGSDCRVLFSFTIFRDNAEQLPGLIRLAAELGVDSVVAMHLIPVREEQRYQSLVYHRALANDVIARARSAAEEAGVELIAPRPFDEGTMSRRDPDGADTTRPPKPCRHPWTSVSVNEKGEVTPCCNSYMVMGDLNSQSFERIWNGRRYRRLRATVNTRRAPANCRTCVLRDYEGTDEPLLLAAIGPNPEFAQAMVVMRRVQRALRRSGVGSKVLPWVKNLYRRRIS